MINYLNLQYYLKTELRFEKTHRLISRLEHVSVELKPKRIQLHFFSDSSEHVHRAQP